jgi:hypothetical protein
MNTLKYIQLLQWLIPVFCYISPLTNFPKIAAQRMIQAMSTEDQQPATEGNINEEHSGSAGNLICAKQFELLRVEEIRAGIMVKN